MHNSKLLTLLRGLQKEELHWFQKFLHAPFYNTSEHPIRLFEYIRHYYPNWDSPKLSKEVACKKLFPREADNIQKLRKVMHSLSLLTEEFLVAMRLRNQPFQKKKLLVEELGNRNIYKPFEKGTKELIKELEGKNYKDEIYFEEQFKLEKQLLSHPQTVRQKDAIASLESLSQKIDKQYFIRKLNLACNFQSAKKIYSSKGQLTFIDEVINEIQKRQLQEIPTLNLYLSVYQLFQESQNSDLLTNLLNDFDTQKDLLSPDDKDAILKCLLNFTAQQINIGNSDFYRKNFDLYRIGLKEGLLIVNGRMSANTFGNIITGGAFLKEFEWAKKFIETHQIHLDSKIRAEVVLFNLANLHFNQQHFEKTIELLLNKNFAVVLYKIMTKTLLLKSYFELFLVDSSYFELVISQIDSFEKYIRREKQISSNNQNSFLNLARYLRKIANAHVRKTKVRKLQQDIINEAFLSNKSWVLTKIKQL